ncbi:hypothetical protein HU200_063786 [Digitaria exilis]|uniref:Uncharacterized protein n=1 Tax=Digitaria exilis TaxID=1010633 RepID=A0A835A4S5_9POAL|nr:hypothetical protein HU200_063786 [Digitaria exilis]
MAATSQTAVLNDLRQAQRSSGPAAVLAIGTAVPANCVPQDQFTDWYFRITKSDHLTELKAKMKRMCIHIPLFSVELTIKKFLPNKILFCFLGSCYEHRKIIVFLAGDKSGIKKRYFHHTEETISSHPELLDRAEPSLAARLRISGDAVVHLAAAAAERAIAKWGRPAGGITHLVVATNSVAGEPGVDLRLASLLGLRPTVRRTLLCLHGCNAGFAAIAVAKDLAENTRGARVLVACAHAVLLPFRSPDGAHTEALVSMALFADGAGAAIVGADDPTTHAGERPFVHLVSSSQEALPGTEHAVAIGLGEAGVDYRMAVEVPAIVGSAIERCVARSVAALGIMANARGAGWNGLFWAVNPGSHVLLDSYEVALGLEAGKLAASRRVLSEYGNMMGATIFFVLDEMRRRWRCHDGEKEAGEEGQWGIMSGLGPGLTIETIVLYAAGRWNEHY